jgi:hypothetical protein
MKKVLIPVFCVIVMLGAAVVLAADRITLPKVSSVTGETNSITSPFALDGFVEAIYVNVGASSTNTITVATPWETLLSVSGVTADTMYRVRVPTVTTAGSALSASNDYQRVLLASDKITVTVIGTQTGEVDTVVDVWIDNKERGCRMANIDLKGLYDQMARQFGTQGAGLDRFESDFVDAVNYAISRLNRSADTSSSIAQISSKEESVVLDKERYLDGFAALVATNLIYMGRRPAKGAEKLVRQWESKSQDFMWLYFASLINDRQEDDEDDSIIGLGSLTSSGISDNANSNIG